MTSGRLDLPIVSTRRKPGSVRDAIFEAFEAMKGEMAVRDIQVFVERKLEGEVSASSVRSYLNLNTPGQFIRTKNGSYRLVRK